MHTDSMVGPEFYYEMDLALAGGTAEGENEAAAAFVDWIRSGFPDKVWVMAAAGPDGTGAAYMTASDLVEAASMLLTSPLPMPEDVATKVREYVSQAPIEHEQDREEGEEGSWASAIFDLKLALAWRLEQSAV